ncbi:aminotransferase class V-fold PLP-dependent enzyme [Actinomycetospora straminea]|uniref:aminotransferase class V-fold PLP-dependent enzyme n=1 Tax=Actinomycetospora straminea TaxID=663607 RepID=UPI002366A736|nr:aminotransferase class V-fold PLP-dependent enzyme [Actinomycetospora straminea]MDD7935950.1 aminotransferase class V-fold PLP-dependent enzyme [Actinomycetospora straminea]
MADLRAAFDVPDEVAYFNTANLAPVLHAVADAGRRALSRRGQPWTIGPQDWFTDVETLRGLVGQLLGSTAEGVALVPSTSYGFAAVAANLRAEPGDRVVVLADEYPSGVYTWRRFATRHEARVVTVVRADGQTWTEAILDAVDERTAVISSPQVHWTDGTWVDLAAVADRARDVGASLVVDASQSLGAVPLDVEALQPDAVVSVGYKWLLGPFGRGYLWLAPAHRDGEPIEENWIVREGSEDFARLTEYRDGYQPGARRFDQGQRTLFELTPMAIAAVEQLLSWGVVNIAAALRATTDVIAERLGRIDLQPVAHPRGPHVLGVDLPAGVRDDVVPALRDAGCFAAVRGSSLRLSPHLHTTGEDIDRLVAALATLRR